MNRSEFCEMMERAKERSGVKISEISFKLQMLLPTLRRFEKGQHNFNMKKCIEYLDAIRSQIVLNGNKKIGSYDELIRYVIEKRTEAYTQMAFAEKIGMSRLGFANVERNKSTMSIDTFLLIADILEITIEIMTYD